MIAEYLEIVSVSIVKRRQRITVYIEHGTYHSILICNGHHYLRARTSTAGDMSWKQLHIGHHLCASLGPCRPAHAPLLTDTVAGHIALEGTEREMLATHEIETYPEPPEGLTKSSCGVGHHAHLLMLIGNIGKKILNKLLIAFRLIGSGVCECRLHKREK